MTDCGYPKTKRLLKPAQFKTVFNQPVFKVHQPHLMAFVCATQQQHARLGMAVTKKKIPTAVARNQLKRLIREQFRHTHDALPVLDIVFIVKKSTKSLTNQQLTDEISHIFRKIISKANHQEKKHKKNDCV